MIRSIEQQMENQYQPIKQIGAGAFGLLILVRSKNNDQIYACKIQKNHGKKMILVEKQFKILADLMDTKRFPEVYSFKVLQKNSYIIMEYLNQNLDAIYKTNNKAFSVKTIALIANQLINSITQLHQHGYLHRDIKPQNIMTCFKSHTIKLIDFGLAQKNFCKRSAAMIGNVKFCSRMAHYGYSGKIHDLQNMLYVIYYFLLPQLPWQKATEADIKFQIQRDVMAPEAQQSFIVKCKYNFLQLIQYPKTSNQIRIAFYQEIHQFARAIHNLKSDQVIDYRNLIHRTQRMMAIVGCQPGDCYDWCPNQCPFYKPLSNYWRAIQSI